MSTPTLRAQTLSLLLSSVYPGSLAPLHLADLEKSQLTAETIRLQGFRSVPPAMIETLLGFNPTITSAMLVPFADPAGGWMPHVRMKIFPALVSKKKGGKGESTVKYFQPAASGVRLYFPRSTMEAACRSSAVLHLVEGEKKAAYVAQQYGEPTIGICGVEGWHTKGTDALLDDFDQVLLTGREVRVYPDSDVKTNKLVRGAVKRLGKALVARGAHPWLVYVDELDPVPDAVQAVAS